MKKNISILLPLFLCLFISCDDADDISADTDCLVSSVSYDDEGDIFRIDFFYNNDQTILDSAHVFENGSLLRTIRIEYSPNQTILRWYDAPSFEFAFQEELTFDSNDLPIKIRLVASSGLVEIEDSLAYQGNQVRSLYSVKNTVPRLKEEYMYKDGNIERLDFANTSGELYRVYEYESDINRVTNNFITWYIFIDEDSDDFIPMLFSEDPLKVMFEPPSSFEPNGLSDTLTYIINEQNYPKVIMHSGGLTLPATITYMNCQ